MKSTAAAAVYVVIPVFNRRAYTLRCVDLLRSQSYPRVEIIVVDDGSTDGTAAALAEQFPEVTVLRGKGNLWWSGGMHMGIAHVLRRASTDDFVLMMNNDTEFPADYVETLVRVSREQVAAVGALTLDAADKSTIVDAGEFIDWDRYAFPVKLQVAPGEKFFDGVDVLPGRGSLVPLRMIRACGNIAKRALPHYIADYEFFCRLKRQGFRLCVTYETWITCDSKVTGFQDQGGRIPIRTALRLMTSRKSMNNVIDHMVFVWLCAPRHRRMALTRLILRGGATLLFMRTPLFDLLKPFSRPAHFLLEPYFLRRKEIEAEGLSPEALVEAGVLRPWTLEECYIFTRPIERVNLDRPQVARLYRRANRLPRKLVRLVTTRVQLARHRRAEDGRAATRTA